MFVSNPSQLSDWASGLHQLCNTGRCTAPEFLRPFHMAMLALRMHGHMPGANFNLPAPLQAYACRMHVWQAINRQPPIAVPEGKSAGKFLPLEPIRDRRSTMESADKLAAIAKTYGADAVTERSLSISLTEIMDNCFAHAGVQGELTGIACAQSWPRGNLAQIAIADLGIGIRKSLEPNKLLEKALSEGNSCELATQFGVTGKPGKGHAGYGLALARQLIEANGGTLIVYSQNELFCSQRGNAFSVTTDSIWPGTVIMLEWRCDRPLSVNDVYATWPLPAGYTDDDFDF